ncbi:MAG: GFA family protein, partial [Woeseiaceae bacterium]|nr:GFA family protein [Woeseiaceae bacterium]
MNSASDTRTMNGHCLCGAVRVTAREIGNKVGACHCTMCRRWAGGPFMEVDCGTDIEFADEDNIAVFNSSDWAERGFCRTCGTHLFYRLKGTGQHMVPVGLFENDAGLVFDTQVFIDEKPAYYEFANQTTNLTGE